jgi:hypothetical protein
MYLLLVVFLTLQASENDWQIPRAYEKGLTQLKKSQFFTSDEWQKLLPNDQKAIRNILILKHAEIRHAPLHKLQLKIFNSFVKDINRCLIDNYTRDNQRIAPNIPNRIFYWTLETNGTFLTNPLKGYYRYSYYDGDLTDSISSDNLPLQIPFTSTSHNSGTWEITTLENYDWHNNLLSIIGQGPTYSENIKSYVPLQDIHSVCPLECRILDDRCYVPSNARSESDGLLITLKNGMQVIWNREESQLYPVGFCRQFNTQQNQFDYCKRMHEYLYIIRKPSQVFERLFLKKFIWHTPTTRLLVYHIKDIGSRLMTIAMAVGGFLILRSFFEQYQLEKAQFARELSNFEKELAKRSMSIPPTLRKRLI